MSTLREALYGIAVILVLLFLTAIIVVGLSVLVSPAVQKVDQTETQFRAACAAVNGNAVWNGRHWECIK